MVNSSKQIMINLTHFELPSMQAVLKEWGRV